MKSCLWLALFSVLSAVLPAAETSRDSKVQAGERAIVHLLATARVSGKGMPDGMRFLFLVRRNAEAKGEFAVKETRDFDVAGQSYQEKTQAAMGKRFEPGTTLDTADNFFSRQPGLRRLAPEKVDGAQVMVVAIGGATLEQGTKGEVTVNVGFDKQVEPFTFAFTVPPTRGGPPPDKGR